MIRYLWYKFDFFVEVVPATADHEALMGPALKKLGLKTFDKKKHYDHVVRRGIVRDLNPDIRTEVKIGDLVLFEGAAGFTMDGDLIDEGLDEYGKGEGHRWLKHRELLAIEEPLAGTIEREMEATHV